MKYYSPYIIYFSPGKITFVFSSYPPRHSCRIVLFHAFICRTIYRPPYTRCIVVVQTIAYTRVRNLLCLRIFYITYWKMLNSSEYCTHTNNNLIFVAYRNVTVHIFSIVHSYVDCVQIRSAGIKTVSISLRLCREGRRVFWEGSIYIYSYIYGYFFFLTAEFRVKQSLLLLYRADRLYSPFRVWIMPI